MHHDLHLIWYLLPMPSLQDTVFLKAVIWQSRIARLYLNFHPTNVVLLREKMSRVIQNDFQFNKLNMEFVLDCMGIGNGSKINISVF